MTYPEEVKPITREDFLKKMGHQPSVETANGFGGPEVLPLPQDQQRRKARKNGEVATRVAMTEGREEEGNNYTLAA